MKVKSVITNNRTKSFELKTSRGTYTFPYAKLAVAPSKVNRVQEAFPDPEIGYEGFTYRLESGEEDTVHIDAVLEYNQDPEYLNELLLHQLTVEARKALEESGISKRESSFGVSILLPVSSIGSLIHPTRENRLGR